MHRFHLDRSAACRLHCRMAMAFKHVCEIDAQSLEGVRGGEHVDQATLLQMSKVCPAYMKRALPNIRKIGYEPGHYLLPDNDSVKQCAIEGAEYVGQ
jgi:hypothetical protein